MTTASASPGVAQPAAAAAAARAGSRLLFVDNIRIFLTVLVILHHLIVIYTGSGGWIFYDGRQDEITAALGGWICAANQAYFMGLFLLISAYFAPGSYDRKGPARFLADRLIRLGIPLAVYGWIVRPVFIYYFLHQDQGLKFWGWMRLEYFRRYSIVGGGPLWFIEVLLLFSLVYVLARLLTRRRPPQPVADAPFPGDGSLVLFALLLGGATFMVRLVFRVNQAFVPLNLQFANSVQYIALFAVGLVAYRRNWLLGLPDKTGRLWIRIAVVLILGYAPLAVLAGAPQNPELFLGGWHWQSMLSAQWEAFVCVGMCLGLIYLFRSRWNSQGGPARELSRSAYTAYLIHEPVITTLAVLALDVTIYPLAKAALVAVIAVPLCFAFSALIRRLPLADRVL